MRATILYPITDQPHGGGNQFLKVLRKWLISQGLYESDPLRADIAIINSHHHVAPILDLIKKRPQLPLVHRIDGPVSQVRNSNKTVDSLIFAINKHLANGTIFQSEWSKSENIRLGFEQSSPSTIISNTPDIDIFYPQQKEPFAGRKIRLVGSSWSNGPYKGFETFQWLDEHLDFSKYDFTFIGNSRIPFRHAVHIQPLKSQDLANELRRHDIYIFPSKREPRSNALLEALSCGLPAIGFNGASNPESIGEGGEYFNEPQEIPSLIKKIVLNYNEYQNQTSVPSISEIGGMYFSFLEDILLKSTAPSRSAIGRGHIRALLGKYKLDGYLRSRYRQMMG